MSSFSDLQGNAVSFNKTAGASNSFSDTVGSINSFEDIGSEVTITYNDICMLYNQSNVTYDGGLVSAILSLGGSVNNFNDLTG